MIYVSLKPFQRPEDTVSAEAAVAETIADRIRLVRGSLSQGQFATRLCVHKNTVGNYERGREPDVGFCLAIRETYGISIDWLVTGIGPMQLAEAVAAPGQVNNAALTGAIAAVEELLAERKVVLSPDKKAKLTSLVYNQLTKENSGGQIERGLIGDLLDLAS